MSWAKNKYLMSTLLLIVLLIIFIKKDVIFAPRYLGDLHLHTTCSDGKNSYEEMVSAAVKKKFSFLAITDHSSCPDIIAKCKAETKLLCIPGRELSKKNTHLLALNTRGGINPDLPLIKQVEEIHRQGGFAIAAHPNANNYLYTDSELANSGIDAQECTSDSKERRFLPCVFDSDAHNVTNLGWQFNSCPVPIDSAEKLKNAILSDKCSRSVGLPVFTKRSFNVETDGKI
jgi:hypothetical protein